MPLNVLTSFPVDQIRQDFPILQSRLAGDRPLVYLDTAATSQKPRVVIAKLVEALEQYNSNVHRGIHQLGDRMTTEMESAREKVQRFLGASEPEEIVFTSGTTMSLNLVAYGYGRKVLRPGDEILLNEMEHHANIVPWQMAAQATGAVLKFLPLTQEGRLDLSRLDEFLTRRTRILAVTAMSNVLGTINPIAELARRAHDVGATVVVDAAQSVPHLPCNVVAEGVDFLAFSGHKLYGPTGIGVLYGRRELLEMMDPFLGGGHMIREVFRERATWADPPAKFEAGTAAFVEAVGLGTAVDYVRQLGLESIAAYEHQLLEYGMQVLSQITGLRIYGPDADHKGAILSFTVDGVHPHDLSDLLDREGVAVRAGHHCTMPLHDLWQLTATARASFAFYNTFEEIDVLGEAIRKARRVFRLPV
ncbi:MAG: cysteine desulfurase [Planctomycetaceae bacterium]|nr:cysteine desulfurase [Planctomycetaceae bacterium]